MGLQVVFRVLARVAASALQALLLLLLARYFGPADFAGYAITYSTGLFVGLASSMGATTRVLRIVGERGSSAHWTTLLRLRALAVIPVVFVLIVLCGLQGLTWPAILGSAAAIADHFADYAQIALAGIGRQGISILVSLTQRVLPAVAVVLVVVAAWPIYIMVISSIVVTGVALAMGFRPTKRSAGIRPTIRSSVGYWVLSMVSAANQLEPVVLGLGVNPSVSGSYMAGSRMLGPLTIPVGAAQLIVIPLLARNPRGRRGHSFFGGLLIASLCYSVLLIGLSPVVVAAVQQVLGAEYVGITAILYAVTIGAAISAVSQAFQSRLVADGAPYRAAIASALGYLCYFASLVGAGIWGGLEWLWLSPLIWQLVTVVAMGVSVTLWRRRQR